MIYSWLKPALPLVCLFAIAFEGCTLLAADVEIIKDASLKEPMEIPSGSSIIKLVAGTKIQILQLNGNVATVSLRRQDGSSLITQLPIGKLEFPKPSASSPTPLLVAPGSLPPAVVEGLRTETLPPKDIPPESPTNQQAAPFNKEADDTQNSPQSSTSALIDLSNKLGPPIKVYQLNFPMIDPGVQIRKLSIDLPDHNELTGRLQVVYDIPLLKDGSPGPRAAYMVYYCPWVGEAKPLDEKVCKFLSGNLGLTVISVEIHWDSSVRAPNNEADGMEKSNPDLLQEVKSSDGLTDAHYSESDVYAQVALEAQAFIESKYGLPYEPLSLVGLSSGSGIAERMAIHHSQMVSSVVLMGGDSYEPVSAQTETPWLVMCARGDVNTATKEAFAASLQSLGARPATAVPEPPWEKRNSSPLFHHGMSDDAFSLCEAYIWDIVNGLITGSVTYSKKETWPFISTGGPDAKVYRSDSQGLSDYPPYIFALPGQNSAYFFSKLQIHPLVSNTQYGNPLWMVEPAMPAKGVIVYDDVSDYQSMTRVIDDIYYLADSGYYVYVPRKDEDSDNPSQLLQWIKDNPPTKDLPVYGVAFGDKASILLKWSNSNLQNNFAGFALINAPLQSSLPSFDHPEVSKPTIFVYDPDPSKNKLSDAEFKRVNEASGIVPKDAGSARFWVVADAKDVERRSQEEITSAKSYFDIIPLIVQAKPQ